MTADCDALPALLWLVVGLGTSSLVLGLVQLRLLVARRARVPRTPKPHRHQWRFNSEERTNMQLIRLHVCAVAGCRDVYRESEPDRTPAAAAVERAED